MPPVCLSHLPLHRDLPLGSEPPLRYIARLRGNLELQESVKGEGMVRSFYLGLISRPFTAGAAATASFNFEMTS